MGRNETTINGGPTLFEAETVLNNADRFDEVYNDVLRRHKLFAETGIYSPFITDELKPHAKTTYCNNAEQLRDVLTASGATPELIDVILTDYATLLCGFCEPTATPKQMLEAATAVKPIRAFLIDRYSVYFGLFLHYLRCHKVFREYNAEVKNAETATPKSKKHFMSGHRLTMDAKAVCWLIRSGIMTLDDWRGFEPAEVSAWIENEKELASIGEYTLFYLIAKCTYNATSQELERITPPPVPTQTSIITIAEGSTDDAIQFLRRTENRYSDLAEAKTQAEQEKAVQAAKDWKDETNEKPIQLHETPNIICSRAVEISPNGAEIINTLPVQQYIDDFANKNPKFGLITPMTVQKVFEAVNLLPNFCTTIENGQYTYKTTRAEFAEICGYKDANQSEKLALFGGLRLLSNLYVIVDRPVRVIETTGKNGRKRKITTGGKTAVQVLNVPEFELEHEGFIINISPEVMRGKPTLINADMLARMRTEAKGLTQSRFNYQVLTKGHKTENELLNEVFGYDEKLKLAQGDAEAYKQAKTYIQNHRSDDRKKLEKWFKSYSDKGVLTYTKTKGKDGAVYSWERSKPFPAEDYPTGQEPDEQ